MVNLPGSFKLMGRSEDTIKNFVKIAKDFPFFINLLGKPIRLMI
jgi:hypothetical protein